MISMQKVQLYQNINCWRIGKRNYYINEISIYIIESNRSENISKEVNIALVGKYIKQPDTYTSMTKALDHASLVCGRKLSVKVCFCRFFF
jgi:CTP synthase (UTP-ammonia lyase)